jgi:Zn-dependent protease
MVLSMLRWRLGTVAGFPIDIKLGFLLLLVVATLGGFGSGGVAALAFVVMLFASIVLHELGHAVVARKRGVGVSGIDLGFFGGAAKMTSAPTSANDEIAIAAAGPAVSLLLSGAGFGLAAMVPTGLGYKIAYAIGLSNAVVAVFNLLPALPMDGGRILRALLSRWSSYVIATDRSVTVARALSLVLVVLGLMYSWQLVLLAPLLWMMGTREKIMARMLAQQFTRDRSGYRVRRFDEIEVLPRDPFRTADPVDMNDH